MTSTLQSATGNYREIVTMLKSGIYSITSPSGKCYIGSARNIARRWTEHRSRLKHNRHENEALQRAYNKYRGALRFDVLEECDEDELLPLEQCFINSYPRAKLYNLTFEVGKGPNISGRRLPNASNIARARMSEHAANRSSDIPASGFPGVVWDARRARWEARASAQGKSKWLGRFESADIANAYRLYWLATQGVFDGS